MKQRRSISQFPHVRPGRRLSAAGLALIVGPGMLSAPTISHLIGERASGQKISLSYALWDPHEEVGYKISIAQFEKTHPNISVTVDEIPYTDYTTKLAEEFTSGSGPDLFWVGPQWEPLWTQDKFMMNLAPLVKSNHINLSQYYSVLVKMHEDNGAIYGLPKDWDTIAYYYNKKYFAEHHVTIPSKLTWDPTTGGSFLTLLKAATTDKSGVNALSSSFNANTIATYGTDAPNTYQTGYGSFWAEDGVSMLPSPYATKSSFDTPAGVQTIQFFQNLMYKWHVAVPGSELGSNATVPSSEDITLFCQGKVAMIEEGDWNTDGIAACAKFPVGVLGLPSGPDGVVSVTNGLIDAINPHTANPKAAWELEAWLGSAASQRIMAAGGYIWPGIESLDPLFVKYWTQHGINVQPFLTEQEGKTIEYPQALGAFAALTVMGRDMGPAYLSGGASVASIMKTSATDANNALASAG
jgi:multiple sugar transport system substrate-binding protein